jgi:phosphoesterase RecJ-like protein
VTEKFYPDLSPRFAELLAHAGERTVAVVGHARPDGDCIGSQVAVARVLSAMGRKVICVNADVVPRRLQYLTTGMKFRRTDEVVADPTEYAPIFVDCADQARPGDRLKERFSSVLGNIDHHVSNIGYAEYNLVDSGSAATCEVLAGICFDNELPVDAQAAQALYTGILTDTGQFRFASTSRRTFLLAAELMARGARPPEAGFELYERETMGKLQLLQRYLASLRLECGGRVCVGLLPNGIFEETGSNAEDTEGLVDYARSIDGVDIGVLIEERPDGTVKASLRSKDPAYRLDRIAAQFNGGGHACAAGLSLKMATLEFRERLLVALESQLQAVPAHNIV